jgi:luciferase family oxidoreductase group 1
MIPYSILDLAPIAAGSSVAEALNQVLDLARHAEALGYRRYWIAEHHNQASAASAATAVVIGHVAAGTRKIRVGSGAILLPNHAPLAIAEQFGTLESLFPGRIDLGLGRAPGGDPATLRALRRAMGVNERFAQEIKELREYFRPMDAAGGVRAIPGVGLGIPMFLMGSSDYSSRLAAELGMPYAFASHCAPDYLKTALMHYRRYFRNVEGNQKPWVIVVVNVIAAETDEKARRLFTSLQQHFLAILRKQGEAIQPPVAEMAALWSPAEELQIQRMTRGSLVGSAQTIRVAVETFIAETRVDEIMATSQIYDPAARLKSVGIFAEVMESLG